MILSWLACSTEDTGLYSYDATNSPQGIDPGETDTPPDPPPSRDAGIVAKHDAAPADAPVTPPAPDVAPPAPDLALDLPPPTDQPLGTACGKDGECKSGHCFDGVCCNSACSDGCSACTQARTGHSDGTCGTADDLEGKACGKGCSTVATVPSLVTKVCVAGACVIPTGKPTVIESCSDTDPCVVAFCDDNAARCVKTSCGQGSCCCRSQNQRMCLRQDQCKGGGRTCE